MKLTMKALTVVLALLFFASGAEGAASWSAGDPAEAPTPTVLSWAEGVAVNYWHGEPACGTPTVTLAPLNGGGGLALFGTCQIEIASDFSWEGANGGWYEFCIAMIHEYGHLTLGPDYFAATNPNDPAHSADPNNIMNADPYSVGYLPACDGMTPQLDARPTSRGKHRSRRHRRAFAKRSSRLEPKAFD